jgi:hypothetical protein
VLALLGSTEAKQLHDFSLNPFQLNYLDVFGNHMIVEDKEEKLAMSNVLSNRYEEMTLGAHDTIESLL